MTAIAAEPGSDSAWLALDSHADAEQPSPAAAALVAHISAEGNALDRADAAPARAEQSIGPKGAGARLACPAPNDCWLATTQGWLFHLAPEGERTLPTRQRPRVRRADHLPPAGSRASRRFRPTPRPSTTRAWAKNRPSPPRCMRQAPKCRRGSECARCCPELHSASCTAATLELRFHLAVKARVRLIAKRHARVVAATPMRTFAAGDAQAAAAPGPAALADEARDADARARATADESPRTAKARGRRRCRLIHRVPHRANGSSADAPFAGESGSRR